MTSSGEASPVITPSGTPSLATHAPKFGTVIANRIFVGGIPANTKETELNDFFSKFGAVKDTKIIADRAGVSKGYGFVTFETQEDADKIIKKEGDNLIFRDRKLNIGPAIRKQTFPRVYDPALSPGALLFSNGVPYTFQNGTAFFHGGSDPAAGYAGYPAQQVSPSAYPSVAVLPQSHQQVQPMYVSQTYSPAAAPSQWPAAAAAAQWRWAPTQYSQNAVQASAASYMYPVQQLASPEMVYAQPAAHGQYQHTDIADASLMEAAPAEGSMPIQCTPRRVHNTGTIALTPRATPPPPMMRGHRLIAKPTNGIIMNVLATEEDSTSPLTPPPTPDVGLQQL